MSGTSQQTARTKLTDELVRRVAQMVRSGDYGPGDRLPAIAELARRFGVGHPSLREALRRLESIGVVEFRHGSGVYVGRHPDRMVLSNPLYGGTVTKKVLMDLVEARIPVEVATAGLAASNATDAQISRMNELLDEARDHLDDDSMLTTNNLAFHREIAIASGNRVLAQLLDALTTYFQREQYVILGISETRGQDYLEHRGLLEAIVLRDTDLARERMTAHLEGVREKLLRWDPDANPLG